jgi:hypothetical protein
MFDRYRGEPEDRDGWRDLTRWAERKLRDYNREDCLGMAHIVWALGLSVVG